MKVKAANSILRIRQPSAEQFLESWKKYQPFIIEDVATHWDACEYWSNEYLAKKCGNNIVPIFVYEENFLDTPDIFATPEGYKKRIKIKYKEYVDEVENAVNHNIDLRYYLSQALFELSFSEIITDVTYPKYFDREPLVNFWHGLSSKSFSATTPLHFDAFHNLFAQIRGIKKIILVPPLDYLSLYPSLEPGGLPDFSTVDPSIPNFELFPKFPWDEKIEVELQPGEMLYIPPYWWHHVTALTENISLSFFYDLKTKDYLRQKGMLSTWLGFVPHYLRHSLSSPQALRNVITSIKSQILPVSHSELVKQEFEKVLDPDE
ncbi:MAG: cupin-like domain-containing protein [Cyanobacteria bacterium J06621_8]